MANCCLHINQEFFEMAEKKKNTKNSRTQTAKKNTKTAVKKSGGKATQTETPLRKLRDENSMLHRTLPYAFVVCAILLGVCFIFHGGALGAAIYNTFFGLFGLISVLIPFLLIYFAACWRKWVSDGQHTLKCIFAVVCILFGGALTQQIMIAMASAEDFTVVSSLFKNGLLLLGGGLFGGIVGIGLYKAFEAAAGIIITCAIIVTFGFFLFGITPRTIWINIKYTYKMQRERRIAAAERAAAEREFAYEEPDGGEDALVPPENPEPFDSTKPFDTALSNPDFDMNIGDEFSETAENPTIPPVEESEPKERNVYNRYGEIDLGAIFVDESAQTPEDTEGGGTHIGDLLDADAENAEDETATLTVTTADEGIAPPVEKKPKAPKAQYRFPPISLLAPPEKKKNEDVGAELRANAQKLVETLKSFHVNVSVASVSRGPTITRYELIPEAGTRVRSIANLVDDISLSLATSGIRIEAPIPGKAAVGIEVPNKTVSTVTLCALIENKTFSEAKSKLAVCLGKDVGGTPIVFDIAKMPHLLIAGATGMGKSVCINSIITSILYKATPDEVKLILIDPKKVEFNIYNGIPHLQIPVVSEPKKAAGALHWAVTEMERRYELIEEVGARKIEPYNEIARQRGLEVLPYTVIIIDELADLMMTAPDAVEDSICRLAQKARAAGMHIIIGTQRPSVDVITGLIKANIPSRIAFTVASQVDSRTIIDIAGAEKLIGRGDMLYYPVGLSKPMRAQGAFVSEDEVEQITAFVKQSVGETEYDADIIESIEREAQAIGQSGKKGGEAAVDDGAGDAKLRDALEIATDLGKISTSLLQRKLSIGYGRAAKIIDIMEARGFVSAPDGQKPREVLVTKTQFREMVVNNDERLK